MYQKIKIKRNKKENVNNRQENEIVKKDKEEKWNYLKFLKTGGGEEKKELVMIMRYVSKHRNKINMEFSKLNIKARTLNIDLSKRTFFFKMSTIWQPNGSFRNFTISIFIDKLN